LIDRDVVRKTKVAIARKIAVIFHCVCVGGISFDVGTDKAGLIKPCEVLVRM
jgi:hypothetical protein